MPYKVIERETRYCLQCGEPLEQGVRSDKKFCSCGCRNSYHNKTQHNSRVIRHRITAAINRNYDVLTRLLRMGVTAMSIPDLAQMGFKPEYITSFFKKGGRTECRCFDMKYYLTPTRIFSLERCSLL